MLSTLKDYDAEKQRADQQARLAAERRTEDTILRDSFTNDDRLTRVFGQHSFDDALAGNASDEAQIIADQIDSALYRAAQKDSRGNVLPITDAAMVKSAIDSVFGRLDKLRQSSIFAPKQADNGQQQNGIKGVVVGDPDESYDESDIRHRHQRVERDFPSRMAARLNGGQPVSQM